MKSRTFRTVAIVSFVLVILLLIFVPRWQVASLRNAKGVAAKDVFKAENDARATLAQIIGGLVVLIGLYIAWENIVATARNLAIANKNLELNTTATAENLKLTNQNLELTKDGQITERFTRAIQQLGDPKLEIRLGGIYALERIARDSEKDHWPVMEVLTAYVREHAPRKKANSPISRTNRVAQKEPPAPLAADIAAIVTVIRRRERHYEKSDQGLVLQPEFGVKHGMRYRGWSEKIRSAGRGDSRK